MGNAVSFHFQHMLEAMFNAKQKLVLESATVLSEKFMKYLRQRLVEVGSYNANLSSIDETTNVVKLNAMVNLYHYIFVSIDNKVIKSLMDINDKVRMLSSGN